MGIKKSIIFPVFLLLCSGALRADPLQDQQALQIAMEGARATPGNPTAVASDTYSYRTRSAQTRELAERRQRHTDLDIRYHKSTVAYYDQIAAHKHHVFVPRLLVPSALGSLLIGFSMVAPAPGSAFLLAGGLLLLAIAGVVIIAHLTAPKKEEILRRKNAEDETRYNRNERRMEELQNALSGTKE